MSANQMSRGVADFNPPGWLLWARFRRFLKLDTDHSLTAVVGTVTEETNDYFATRYWALKKVTIISLLVTGLRKKVTIISLLVIGI